jgi:sugar lactone lactonase YvrE
LTTPLKPRQIKHLCYTAVLFCIIVCAIPACKTEWISPGNVAPINDSTGTGGTTPVDTLPTFNSPSGVAVDASGNIYVADWGNNLIREISNIGVVSTFAGSGFAGYNDATGTLASFTMPTGLAIDPQGNIFVADAGNNLIREVTPAAVVTTIAGSDTTGYADGQGAAAVFFNPLGVAVDANDNVYVADAGNNLVRLVTSAGVVSTFAGTYNSGASTTLSPFNNPTSLALRPNGYLYVTNYLDDDILQVSQGANVITYAGQDTVQGAANGPALSATFFYPNSVAADNNGNLYVSDGVNNIIRKIDGQGNVTTFAGSGVPGAIDSTGVYASFNGPAGLAVDAAGNVYVADANNNEIRKITPAGVVTTIAGTGVQGAQNGIAVAHRNRRALKIKLKPRFDMIFRPKARRRT